MGTESLRSWRPTAEEVEQIVAEMRPILAELARHQALPPDVAHKRSA